MKNISSFIDSTRAFKPRAFEIVLCPPFDYADLLAKEEDRSDDAGEDDESGHEEVGWGHSDKGLTVGEIIDERHSMKWNVHISQNHPNLLISLFLIFTPSPTLLYPIIIQIHF